MSSMAGTKSIDDLQLKQDMAHQRREWRVQRIGWAVMALLLLAALAGLLGPGPLSRTVVNGADSRLRVEYDRFAHTQAPGELLIELPADIAKAGTVRLRLNREFVESVEIMGVVPEPASSTIDGNGLVYELATRASARPVTVAVQYEYRVFGSTPVRVAIEGGPAVSFDQWVYP
jgi:hypothetical protein